MTNGQIHPPKSRFPPLAPSCMYNHCQRQPFHILNMHMPSILTTRFQLASPHKTCLHNFMSIAPRSPQFQRFSYGLGRGRWRCSDSLKDAKGLLHTPMGKVPEPNICPLSYWQSYPFAIVDAYFANFLNSMPCPDLPLSSNCARLSREVIIQEDHWVRLPMCCVVDGPEHCDRMSSGWKGRGSLGWWGRKILTALAFMASVRAQELSVVSVRIPCKPFFSITCATVHGRLREQTNCELHQMFTFRVACHISLQTNDQLNVNAPVRSRIAPR